MKEEKPFTSVDSCPKCGAGMEQKAWIPVEWENGSGFYVYQCPKCKNIELQ